MQKPGLRDKILRKGDREKWTTRLMRVAMTQVLLENK